jgi:uncharacterized protein
MMSRSAPRPRLLPEKRFPAYAYLPGRQPHPVRDPMGHSYHDEPMPIPGQAPLGSEAFRWGMDLFNHGYYWEAHEAWEALWQAADRSASQRLLFKALILLAAAGVKIREGKQPAAARHARRAMALFRRIAATPSGQSFDAALGMPLARLADCAEATATAPAALPAPMTAQPEPVFSFILGPIAERSARAV